jgi:hypothetical protein
MKLVVVGFDYDDRLSYSFTPNAAVRSVLAKLWWSSATRSVL